MRWLLVVLLIGLGTSTGAAGNQTFSAAELSQFIPGKSINFGFGAANYLADGSYIWRGGGKALKGRWHLKGDKVCINFRKGGQRCDRYGRVGIKYFGEDGTGKRYDIYHLK